MTKDIELEFGTFMEELRRQVQDIEPGGTTLAFARMEAIVVKALRRGDARTMRAISDHAAEAAAKLMRDSYTDETSTSHVGGRLAALQGLCEQAGARAGRSPRRYDLNSMRSPPVASGSELPRLSAVASPRKGKKAAATHGITANA